MKRYRVSWTGSPVVGGGLSTFYTSPSSEVGGADDIEAFFSGIGGVVATGVQWVIPSSGDMINSEDGSLAGSWSDPGTGGTVASSGSGSWANGVGARIVWNTDGLFRGRRVRGSTFVVPIWISGYEGAGNLTSTTITQLQNTADALVAALPELGIWSRPVGLDAGEFNAVTSATVPDKVSWLRSRRT
jgi:hypothetical protein